ncbi:DUF1796 family putative cysteine peptidase [Adlercreutzia sp. ZJ473]|uniref:DUF1796 family putative cysteine peptidase n=1 Tax=Adlercreutzia sp. ZJ473 TaxID=2722822 RepID=UPI0015555A84|nr:DUF1796 family putative cysteine peptidase [Adlercreutzia sp. ZJ473]
MAEMLKSWRNPVQLESRKFEHIVSLGYFCSVALELERFGLRDTSGPFDWVISPWWGVCQLMNDGFSDLFMPDLFEQDPTIPEHYRNAKYGIAFYHDFDRWRPFGDQLPMVRDKYVRRIERFYENALEPTLFVRYVRDEAELDNLTYTLPGIMGILRGFNRDSDIMLVGNRSDLGSGRIDFSFDPDRGDVVARRFLDNDPLLAEKLVASYPCLKRKSNIARYAAKEAAKRKEPAMRLFKLVGHRAKKSLVRPYVHSLVAGEAF